MLNTLINDIAIYDYKQLIYINNNYINNLLNNDYDYVITIDYYHNQIDIDLYEKNSHNILFNINIYNKDAFNLFVDAILNKDNYYSIIKINKYTLTF